MFGNNNMVDSYGFGNFFSQIMAESQRFREERRDKNAGIIQNENLLFGVPEKNIDTKYYQLNFLGYYVGVIIIEDKNGTITKRHVYDKTGKFLFECKTFNYLGHDIFLVISKIDDKSSTQFGSLYKNNIKMTDEYFSMRFGSSFKNRDICVLGTNSKSERECVVNKECEIVYNNKNRGLSSIYIDGNIIKCDNEYINSFTGETICEGYSSIKTDKLKFVESGNNVFKINKETCEFEMYGPPIIEKEEEKPVISKKKVRPETKPKTKKLNRNDLCSCESGLKYKFCCGKNNK